MALPLCPLPVIFKQGWSRCTFSLHVFALRTSMINRQDFSLTRRACCIKCIRQPTFALFVYLVDSDQGGSASPVGAPLRSGIQVNASVRDDFHPVGEGELTNVQLLLGVYMQCEALLR